MVPGPRSAERPPREVVRLSDRVAALETPASTPPTPAPAPKAVATPPIPAAAPRLDDELVTVIAAAVAAFLGKRAHVRQIRLLGSAAWTQHGRVTIQASHVLTHHSH